MGKKNPKPPQGSRSKPQKILRHLNEKQMPCPNCGNLISVLSKQHNSCGWKLKEEGSEATKFCPKCGEMISLDAKQHSTCGWRLPR